MSEISDLIIFLHTINLPCYMYKRFKEKKAGITKNVKELNKVKTYKFLYLPLSIIYYTYTFDSFFKKINYF